jgi:hypothetical protein
MVEPCAGSLGEAIADAATDDFGRCPVCGSTLLLGYAGLLPVHPGVAPAAPRDSTDESPH